MASEARGKQIATIAMLQWDYRTVAPSASWSVPSYDNAARCREMAQHPCRCGPWLMFYSVTSTFSALFMHPYILTISVEIFIVLKIKMLPEYGLLKCAQFVHASWTIANCSVQFANICDRHAPLLGTSASCESVMSLKPNWTLECTAGLKLAATHTLPVVKSVHIHFRQDARV